MISRKKIKAQLEDQLNLFTGHFNRQPDFIDGHHHIHQFPVIRECLLEVYQQRFSSSQITIRSTYPIISLPQYQLKSRVLSITGGKAFQRQLSQLEIPHHKAFAGTYDFNPNTAYRALFQQWLSHAPDDTLIMCHPGIQSPLSHDNDTIALCRQHEWEYFISDGYLQDLQDNESKLACSSII